MILPGASSQTRQTTIYTHIWVSEGSPQKASPSTPRKPFKTEDGPVYVPAEVYNLLSPEAVTASRKAILRPSTSLPIKEVFMSLILLNRNHRHQTIPFMRNNQTVNSLKMHLKMRLTQFWITSTVDITRKKI